jgi:hypothetical protein
MISGVLAFLSEKPPRVQSPPCIQPVTLNFSPFVARNIRRRRSVSPLRGRAHRLQRRKPLPGLLVPMATIFDLLQKLLTAL